MSDRNEEAEEIERLERSEFVIDTEQERKLITKMQQKANAVHYISGTWFADSALTVSMDSNLQIERAHETFNLTNEAIAARIRELCWDSQTTHVVAVHALARPGLQVRKFGVQGKLLRNTRPLQHKTLQPM